MREISPKDRIDMNWTISYITYTLYDLMLRINNEESKFHPIKDELKRLEEAFLKVKECARIDQNKKININQEAANRMITNAISMNKNIIKCENKKSDNTLEIKTKRKLKGSIPLAEQPNLNINKNK